ncbi:uncharacterized protein RAG0_05907 [Rhynchosporium agropyri]|uniref:Uncharacterized protein n=1 Tax=Rhynchosporium agropyri TaxID=914238 RepID=A0A1E1KF76_9HELO|nr:uncharacterized protein RAG0_05907 [Rhynchosporium agropyri]
MAEETGHVADVDSDIGVRSPLANATPYNPLGSGVGKDGRPESENKNESDYSVLFCHQDTFQMPEERFEEAYAIIGSRRGKS